MPEILENPQTRSIGMTAASRCRPNPHPAVARALLTALGTGLTLLRAEASIPSHRGDAS